MSLAASLGPRRIPGTGRGTIIWALAAALIAALYVADDLVPWAEALLFAAARAQLAEQTLRPLLEA